MNKTKSTYGHNAEVYRSTGLYFTPTHVFRQTFGGGLILAKTCM
ncbi:hypothetical protein [Solibacillus ferritrahens]